MTARRRLLESFKIACLAAGVRPTERALRRLTGKGDILSIHEYPTTGGLTLVLDDNVYVNSPFDEWFCEHATTELDMDGDELVLRQGIHTLGVSRVLPLPGYIHQESAEVAMSHADRVRVSPLAGCAYDCGFCDIGAMDYQLRPAQRMIEAIEIACADPALPSSHVLISGGSPRKAHYEEFIETCEEIILASRRPVDVMFSPMVDNLSIVDRLVEAGVAGFAINIELFSDGPANEVLGRKYRATRQEFEPCVRRAVELLGSGGRVRSLIIVGLEPPEATLKGVEYLASLGCDPVLSPFRPAGNIRLAEFAPPQPAVLAEVLAESRAVVARHGVALGPDCVPCQHNTLTFPWDVRAPAAEKGPKPDG